jgi:hypothetical protein
MIIPEMPAEMIMFQEDICGSKDPPPNAINNTVASPKILVNDGVENTTLVNDGVENTAYVLAGPTPSQAPDPKLADSLIARAMSACTRPVLEQAYYDVHGIATEIEETPSFIESNLAELDRQVRNRNDNQAYLLAEEMNLDYVRDRDFRLMFLRSDRFNIKGAALRLVRHFQVKLELFGKEKLALDITQDDLDKDSMETLYSGLTQVLPTRDRSGRAIMLWVANGAQSQVPTLAKVSVK